MCAWLKSFCRKTSSHEGRQSVSSKKVLGRGVGALLPDAGDDLSEEKYFLCDINKIQANPNQPRVFFDEDKLQELAESIRENGVIQPLLVTRGPAGRYTLVAGERRLRAAKLVQLDEVPVLLLDELQQDQSLELALIENIQRQDLNAIEEAQAYARLMEEFQLTQEEVGRRVGRQRSTISNAIRLLSLPSAIQQDVAMGMLSEGHARVLLRVKDDAGRLQSIRDKILTEGLSVRAAERLCVSPKPSISKGVDPKAKVTTSQQETLSPSHCQALATQLGNHLHTRTRIVQQGQRGRLEIEYYSSDDLDRLMSLLLE